MNLNIIERIKRWIKLVYAYPNYRKIIKKINLQSGKNAILIGTPVHGNLGDHLIASESIKYLKKFDFTDVIEIPEIMYELFYKKIKISPNDIIFISGGGWMGSLYYDELIIEDVIMRWPNNHIVILPQTISFTGGNYTTPEKISNLVNSHKNILLTLRDENSYNLCIDLLKVKKEKLLLLPDMALNALNSIYVNNKKDNSIIFSIRDDREKNSEIDVEKFSELLKEKNFNVRNSSSVINKKVIKVSERENYLNNKIKEFSNAELVITDRLHSMVFSLLADTKCIALDNSTHKVVGVYKKWLSDVKSVCIVDNSQKLDINFLENVIKSNNRMEAKRYTKELEELDQKIGEMLS